MKWVKAQSSRNKCPSVKCLVIQSFIRLGSISCGWQRSDGLDMLDDGPSVLHL